MHIHKKYDFRPDNCAGIPPAISTEDVDHLSNPVALPEPYFHFSCTTCSCCFFQARGIVCVVTLIVLFSNHRLCLEKYRFSQPHAARHYLIPRKASARKNHISVTNALQFGCYLTQERNGTERIIPE